MNGITRWVIVRFTTIFLRLSEITWRKAILMKDNKVRQHSKSGAFVR